MQFSTLALAASTLALASAAPAASVSESVKRSCTVLEPTTFGLPIDITITRDASKNEPLYLSFAVPAGAGGPCSLVAKFPAGYPINAAGGAAQVNVRALDGPATGSIVGTYTFRPNSAPQFNTINSFACRPELAFNFEIASDSGSVEFIETTEAGLFMTYGC